MPNATDRIADDLVYRQVQVLRFAEGLNDRLLAQLREAEAQIIKMLERTDLTRYTVQRTRSVLDNIRRILREYAGDAYQESRSEVSEMAALIAARTARDINAFLTVDVVDPVLSERKLLASMNDVSVLGGATMKDFWQRQPDALTQAYAAVIRNGVATNMTTGDLIKVLNNDPGIFFQRSTIRTLARTSSMNMANDARLAMYDDNTDLIKGIQWLSTLDLRTSTICRALDGKMWDTRRQPIDHSIPFPGSTAHPNCRSTQVPVLRSFEELATRNKSLARQLDASMPRSTRASMDGQVSQDMDYEEWLRAQPAHRAREALGPGRYDLWRDASVGAKKVVLTVAEMVDQRGRGLTLAELRRKFE